MENCTSGMYAWGGPGTKRLLRTKYHRPSINEQSFDSLYGQSSLIQAKELFGLSDVWVTYSWGFSHLTEQGDYEFIRSRLSEIHGLGLRAHGYVQGLNVVYSEFANENIFCRDPRGNLLPYSKGRKLICPNNPAAVQLLVQRVTQAASEDFDGVYVDNILFGFPPAFIRSDFAPFFGCSCLHCREKFEKTFSYPLSFPLHGHQHIADYLKFRVGTTDELISKLSDIVRGKKKYFGINLFDPVQMNALIYFGYELARIEPYLDYLLIENHNLPSDEKDNSHLLALITHAGKKPVFVVSYDRGIGFEVAYSQSDYEGVASEAAQLGYKPCYKVSEFTTNHLWHTSDFSRYTPLQIRNRNQLNIQHPQMLLRSKRWFDPIVVMALYRVQSALATLYFESEVVNYLGHYFYRKSINSWKNFSISQ